MILKFIHPSFELDFEFEPLKLVEENHWFSDQFFTKYSFPVSFDVTDELNQALGLILNMNAKRSSKRFEGYFLMFGREFEALFIIERIEGKRGTGKFRYGFEEFPNYDRKLSTLSLHFEPLSVSIEQFAAGKISQAYPATKFNFPQIICDKFDTDSNQWKYYEGVLNNYQNGAFLVNEYDDINDEQINRNVMQPMPYLLHVLERGFADAGLELRGNILEDEAMKKALLITASEYYSTISDNSQVMQVNCDQYDSIESVRRNLRSGYVDIGTYTEVLQINEPGRYNISGSFYTRVDGSIAGCTLHLGTEEIYNLGRASIGVKEEHHSINLYFDVGPEVLTTPLSFWGINLAYGLIDGEQIPDAPILDISITRVAAYDENGALIPALISPEEINLQKCVPDITFGELLKIFKNWRNLDIKSGDGFFEINFINDEMDKGDPVNLEAYEVKYPVREFFEDKSYILKFEDVSSDKYSFSEVFVDSQGSRTNEFVRDENTQEIVINAIPLPIGKYGTVYTADLFVDDKSKVCLAVYDGLNNNLNTTRDANAWLIPAIYQSDYKEWLDFRIHADGITWEFKCPEHVARNIEKDSRVSAYRKNLLIKRLTRTNLSGGFWEVSLETEGRD